MFTLFNIMFSIGLTVIDDALGLTYGETYISNGSGISYSSSGGLLNSLYSAGLLIPRLAVSARKLHDVNKSG